MQPKTSLELQRQFLNEHAAEYVAFTRSLLTVSAGSLALLAGLSAPKQPGIPQPWTAEAAFQVGWTCLCLSLLMGLALQWVIVLRPLEESNRVKKLETQAQAHPGDLEPVVFRRLPQRRQRWYFHGQVLFFAGAFVALTLALMTR